MRSKMLLIASLMLTTLGTGCKPEVIAVADVSWYTLVQFSEDTKGWFDRSKPPAYVIKDMNVVLKNNEKYKAIKEQD